jgi:hypothetical protein
LPTLDVANRANLAEGAREVGGPDVGLARFPTLDVANRANRGSGSGDPAARLSGGPAARPPGRPRRSRHRAGPTQPARTTTEGPLARPLGVMLRSGARGAGAGLRDQLLLFTRLAAMLFMALSAGVHGVAACRAVVDFARRARGHVLVYPASSPVMRLIWGLIWIGLVLFQSLMPVGWREAYKMS